MDEAECQSSPTLVNVSNSALRDTTSFRRQDPWQSRLCPLFGARSVHLCPPHTMCTHRTPHRQNESLRFWSLPQWCTSRPRNAPQWHGNLSFGSSGSRGTLTGFKPRLVSSPPQRERVLRLTRLDSGSPGRNSSITLSDAITLAERTPNVIWASILRDYKGSFFNDSA